MISKKDLYLFREKRRILLQSNDFICLLPHKNLQAYISNYNITFPSKTIMPDSFTEIPCGCATISVENNNKYLFVNLDGPAAKPHIMGKRANELKMLVTVEFKPAGLYILTGINQQELADKTISFESADSKLSKLISQTVENAESISELTDNLDLLLLKNIYGIFHPQLIPALQEISLNLGNISIKKLAENLHYSQRQLNRIFKQHVGISPKNFSRLIRINNTFNLLKDSNNSLTFISDIMEFHDLSHFVRDFKSVCEITPQEYRKNMSDFYINPNKF